MDRDDETSAVSLLKRILEDAHSYGATTIQIEPLDGDATRIRFRVDGQLREGRGFPRVIYPALVGRVKGMAGMDAANVRTSQSGVIRFGSKRQGVDYIVTTEATAHGEALCLSVNPTAETDTSDLRSSPTIANRKKQ